MLPTTHETPVREERFKYVPLSRIFMSEHYRLREFCRHDLALYFGIRNVPTELGLARGRMLVQKLIEPAHAEFGPLRILQGYVSAELNAKRMRMGAVASPTSLHMWDRRPDKGMAAPVACDFCIRGREGDLNAQRLLVEFYAGSDLKWNSILVFPRTSSIHLTHSPRKGEFRITLRLEFVAGRARARYFDVRNYRNIPWHLLHQSDEAGLAAAMDWLRERGELKENRRKSDGQKKEAGQPGLFSG